MTPEEQSRAIDELEADLERLHALYNQYFMGIEKLEPLVPRKSVERKINLLRREKLRSTALRFRFQTQIQKYNTHTNYWRRICRQIEEGTYKRHLLRAQKRTEEKIRETLVPGSPAAHPDALDAPESDSEKAPAVYDLGSLDEFGLDEPFGVASPAAQKPAPGSSEPPQTQAKTPSTGLRLDDIDEPIEPSPSGPPRPTPQPPPDEQELEEFFSTRPPPPPPGSTPPPPAEVVAKPSVRGDKTPTPRVPVNPKNSAQQREKDELDARKAQAIYRTFLEARKRTRESTDGVSFEKIKRSLEKQYNAKAGRVDFKVIIRNGKAVIAAVPRKD